MLKKTPKIGRPKKTKEMKKSEKVFVNLTINEKKKLELRAMKENLSFSQLCHKALRGMKYI